MAFPAWAAVASGAEAHILPAYTFSRCFLRVQKAGSNVAAAKAGFISGQGLRQAKACASQARGSLVVTAEAAERPLWFPGSSAPEWLDGR